MEILKSILTTFLFVYIIVISSCSGYKYDLNEGIKYYNTLNKESEKIENLFNIHIKTRALDGYCVIYFEKNSIDSIIGISDYNKITISFEYSDYKDVSTYKIKSNKYNYSNDEKLFEINDDIEKRLINSAYNVVSSLKEINCTRYFDGNESNIMFQVEQGVELHYIKNDNNPPFDIRNKKYIKINSNWYLSSENIRNEKQNERIKKKLLKRNVQ